MEKDPPNQGPPDGELPSDPSNDHVVRVQQLFVKHQSSLKAFVLSLQPDYAEAEDILQEVFLLITRKAQDFRDEEGSSFMGWAITIARFKVLEASRRRKATERALSEQAIECLTDTLPDESFFERRLVALRACLDKLAPRMQEVIRLRYFAQHGPRQIAQQLSWTTNSVNVALAKARKFVYECVLRKLRQV